MDHSSLPSVESPPVDSSSNLPHGALPETQLRHGPLKLAVAGLLSAIVGWWLLAEFPVSWQSSYQGTTAPPKAEQQRQMLYRFLNVAVVFAAVGAAIAFGCGCGHSLARRAWKVLFAVAVPSLALGFAGGAISTWCASRLQPSLMSLDIDLAKNILSHMVVWGGVGLGVGCAAALSAVRWAAFPKAMAAGSLGGVISAAGFVVVAAVFFPSFVTDDLLPARHIERLALFASNGLLMGLFVGMSLVPAHTPQAKPTPTRA